MSTWHWALIGVMSVLIKFLADCTPQSVEQLYSRGLYLWIRKFWDISFAYSPIPLFYVFWIVVVIFVYWLFRGLTQKNMPISEKRYLFLTRFFNALGFLITSFYILWGFNYSRPSFFKQIGLKIDKIDTIQLRQELEITVQEMIAAKSNLVQASLPTLLEQQMRNDISHVLQAYKFSAGGKLRGRSLTPNGILRRFGATGVYWPWAGECNMDNSIHPLEKPFTMAHELAHGYGWADEGTCNFLAYLSCRKSENQYVQYAGSITYYRYVASNFKRHNPVQYELFRQTLPPDIIQDLDAINANAKLYPEWFDTSYIYEKYLKSQGIKEGLNSYSRIILMVHAWRNAQ
jgi:hypothetical protein